MTTKALETHYKLRPTKKGSLKWLCCTPTLLLAVRGFPMSHLNTSIYHCLTVAAKSFLSWDRRICEKCFLRLGKALGCCLTLCSACDISEWTLSSRLSCASSFQCQHATHPHTVWTGRIKDEMQQIFCHNSSHSSGVVCWYNILVKYPDNCVNFSMDILLMIQCDSWSKSNKP